MDEQTISELESQNGHLVVTEDYEIRLYFNSHSHQLGVKINTKDVDARGNHRLMTIELVEKIMEDLKDLSDWRHYRRLKNKLHS